MSERAYFIGRYCLCGGAMTPVRVWIGDGESDFYAGLSCVECSETEKAPSNLSIVGRITVHSHRDGAPISVRAGDIGSFMTFTQGQFLCTDILVDGMGTLRVTESFEDIERLLKEASGPEHEA